MSIVHVPFYPSDWLAGTRGLSDAETGVYITLIARMYEMAGPIERDDNRLSRLCGCKSRAGFVKSLNYLISEGKILEADGALFNEKVAKVIKETTEKSSKAKAAAQSRWDRKSNKNNDIADANASAKHMPQPCQPKPKPYRDTKVSHLRIEPERFQDFWDQYPHRGGAKKGRKPAEVKYLAAIKSGATETQIIQGAIRYATDRQAVSGYAKDPATWLNQRGWEDEVEPAIALQQRSSGLDTTLDLIATAARARPA